MSGGLSNNELKRIAYHRRIPLDGVYSKDQLVKMRVKPNTDFNCIVNLMDLFDEEGNQLPGSHWVALSFFSKERIWTYFDSFGFLPPVEVINFCRRINHREIIYSNKQIQDIESSWCGLYALLFTEYMRSHKNSIRERYRSFEREFGRSKNRILNDKVLKQLIQKYF